MANTIMLKDKEIDQLLDKLLEAKRTSRAIITRQTKIKKATSQLASIEGRSKNDPLYSKMVKYRTLYYKYRQMLHRKYGPRVRSRARL